MIPCNRWPCSSGRCPPKTALPSRLRCFIIAPSPVPPKSNLSSQPLEVPYVFLSSPLPIITTIIRS